MIPVADVLTRVGLVMQDEDFVRWTKPELIGWINDAAKEVVVRRPAAGANTLTFTMSEGVTQQLPTNTLLLLDLVRNLPNGRRISLTDRRRLEESVPRWYAMRPAASVIHYCYDDRNPRSVHVYPPAKAGIEVEAVIAQVPADVTGEQGSVNLSPEYIGPLVSYCLYRAHAKDSEYASGQLAIAHFQAFSEAMGVNTTMKLTDSPKRAAP